MTALRIGPIGGIYFTPPGLSAVASSVEGKLGEIVSLLDFMTDAQKADAIGHSMVLDQTAPVQAAFNALAQLGGGVLEWYDVKITSTIVIQSSNITVVPRGGNKLNLAGNVRYAIQVYPTSLNGIVNGTDRPAGYTSGIAGQGFETLMYESNDANRLHDIEIRGLEYSFSGSSGSGGRFIDAYSVDRMKVIGCKASSNQNTVSLWYCRDAHVWENDLTCNNTSFNLMFYRTYGEAAYNAIRNGYIGSETKGCYPQSGKTIYEGYDSDYEFWHPVKIHHNKFYDIENTVCQMGYFDNATTDISTGTPAGITLSQWFGQVWGGEITDNSATSTSAPVTQSGAYRFNVNSRFCRMERNKSFGGCILTFGSRDCEIVDNVIVNSRVASTAAIEIAGFSTGAVSRNSQRIKVARNRIVGHQRNAIYVRGGDYCDVTENSIADGKSGFVQIQVDSTNSATTSKANHVLNNKIVCTPTDFAYPIKSTGADYTVIDGNRAYGGWFTGNALDSDGFSDNHYKRGVVSADTPTCYVGSAGTCSVGQNFGDKNATTAVAGYSADMTVNGVVAGGWRQPARIADARLWVAALGNIRTKNAKASSDTDGSILGAMVGVPSTGTTAGVPGNWAADTSNVYFYTGDGTTHSWRKVAISSF